MNDQDDRVFSVKCLFRHEPLRDSATKHLYEERVTIWKAASPEIAMKMAEEEAVEYADGLAEYLGYAMLYSTGESEIVPGMEVFSEMRDDDLDPTEYIDRHYDTGRERARKWED